MFHLEIKEHQRIIVFVYLCHILWLVLICILFVNFCFQLWKSAQSTQGEIQTHRPIQTENVHRTYFRIYSQSDETVVYSTAHTVKLGPFPEIHLIKRKLMFNREIDLKIVPEWCGKARQQIIAANWQWCWWWQATTKTTKDLYLQIRYG